MVCPKMSDLDFIHINVRDDPDECGPRLLLKIMGAVNVSVDNSTKTHLAHNNISISNNFSNIIIIKLKWFSTRYKYFINVI